jgi:hypothetical protein
LNLGLVNVKFDAIPQRLVAGFAQRSLHTPQRLLLRAVGISQFLSEEFANC